MLGSLLYMSLRLSHQAGTPFYGTTPVRQYTWFTFTPSNDDPLTVKLSVLNGGADIFVKAGSPATRGNQDWNASVRQCSKY